MPECVIETARYRTSRAVLALVYAFESCTLRRAEWTHPAHLTVALWYCLRHPAPLATVLIRDGIRRYNRAHGIAETPTGGYHETLTLFWIRMVRNYLAEAAGARERHTLAALANGLVARYGDKNLPFKFYTRARLFAPAARAGWVEPDLQPLAGSV